MKTWKMLGVSIPMFALLAVGCAAAPEAEDTGASEDAVTATTIPSGWDKRCVVVAPAGLAVRKAASAEASMMWAASCHDWLYPEGAESNGFVKVHKLPRGAEAGTKTDPAYAVGYVKAAYLNCYDKASGIDAGVWVNAVPGCGPTGLDIVPVNKAEVQRDAQSGVSAADGNFSQAWIKERSNGFSFFGKSAVAGTAICSYMTSTESGVVAQARLGVGGEFYCQVVNKPGAKFFYWFK